MKPAVVVLTASGADNFTSEDRSKLGDIADVAYLRVRQPLAIPEIASIAGEAEFVALTPRAVPRLDEAFVAVLPRLRGVSIFATGVDHVDLSALNRRGILLANLPDYSTLSVAEHTIGLMLTMSRRIHLSNDRVRGRVPPNASIRGYELYGKTLGIIGFGRIGSRVARLADAFGMTILAYDPNVARTPLPNVKFVALEDLFQQADWITFHRPFNPDGKTPYDARLLERTKPGVTLVNTARPGLVDAEAVERLIREGRIRGYAVDEIVYTDGKAADLIREGRIVQTGHSAWYSTEVLERGYSMLLHNLYRMVAGEPVNLVSDGGNSYE